MRGAYVHSAQALGAAGLGCTAPRGLQVRGRFWDVLTSFRLFCLGIDRVIPRVDSRSCYDLFTAV